jgi:ABC-2 type transport system ATP-binding protein
MQPVRSHRDARSLGDATHESRKEHDVIEVDNVTKRYGQRLAVDHLNFTVNKGEILGFLGPNGAGKSTTMNIITGYLSATEGTVRVDGHDILAEPEDVKRNIGYMPELPPLYMDMTVEDYLSFVCEIKRVPRNGQKKDRERAMELLKLTHVRGRLIKNLSKGYKQRVGVAQAIIGTPPVLILDEPTIGLDPAQIIETRNLIRGLGKEHTIVLSSHILPEVSAVCDRVLIINKGRIAASGTPENLSRGIVGENRITVRIKGAEADVLTAVRKVPDVVSADVQGIRESGTVDVLVEAHKDRDIREPLFRALSQASLPILMMKTMDLTLEDIFLNLTTDEKEAK